MTLVLGIETSCDETAAAVVRDGETILSNVVASQIALHAPYGGVFPEVASRAHIEAITPVVSEALDKAGVGLDAIDAIAVTRGPGLAGSLLVGMNYAKGLALGADLPLIGVNHLEGHIYSLGWPSATRRSGSGRVPDRLRRALRDRRHRRARRVRDARSTIDDAAGEAFDKVARLLGLDYPGGPASSGRRATATRRRIISRALCSTKATISVFRG